jgi:hypothetical protein
MKMTRGSIKTGKALGLSIRLHHHLLLQKINKP